MLRDTENIYGSDSTETIKTINSLNEIKKIRQMDEDTASDKESEMQEENEESNDVDDNESIVFSSESIIFFDAFSYNNNLIYYFSLYHVPGEEDEKENLESMENENNKSNKSKINTRNSSNSKKYTVKVSWLLIVEKKLTFLLKSFKQFQFESVI